MPFFSLYLNRMLPPNWIFISCLNYFVVCGIGAEEQELEGTSNMYLELLQR